MEAGGVVTGTDVTLPRERRDADGVLQLRLGEVVADATVYVALGERETGREQQCEGQNGFVHAQTLHKLLVILPSHILDPSHFFVMRVKGIDRQGAKHVSKTSRVLFVLTYFSLFRHCVAGLA